MTNNDIEPSKFQRRSQRLQDPAVPADEKFRLFVEQHTDFYRHSPSPTLEHLTADDREALAKSIETYAAGLIAGNPDKDSLLRLYEQHRQANAGRVLVSTIEKYFKNPHAAVPMR
jgi:hypothetical protein